MSYQILYHLNNNLSFHLYENYAEVTKGKLTAIRKKLMAQNGKECTMQVVATDDKNRVVLTAVKLSKEDERILTKVGNYRIKRGI